MRAVVFLGDGMADWPVEALGGRTPLDTACHPNMDRLARFGLYGLARTVPEGMPPGSDTANLSVFGYDPEIYYTGRSPLEAVNMGIPLGDNDVTYRVNTVTLAGGDRIGDCVMEDYSGGEIDSALSRVLIEDMAKAFSQVGELYPGISYRHCLVRRDAADGAILTPPHDISGRPVRDWLPKGENGPLLLDMMERSYALLREHPVNKRLAAEGRPMANCLWVWGEGRKPRLPSFEEKFGVRRGGVISAVDLVRGIGRCAGLEVLPVEGRITGTFETDFAAKGRAAVKALEDGCQFLYIHVEAPDECGHHGQLKEKIYSIEQIDGQIMAPVLRWLEGCGEDYAVMVLPDHPTPMRVRTHVPDPVPFALYDSREARDRGEVLYCEKTASQTGLLVEKACTLMERMLRPHRT